MAAVHTLEIPHASFRKNLTTEGPAVHQNRNCHKEKARCPEPVDECKELFLR